MTLMNATIIKAMQSNSSFKVVDKYHSYFCRLKFKILMLLYKTYSPLSIGNIAIVWLASYMGIMDLHNNVLFHAATC